MSGSSCPWRPIEVRERLPDEAERLLGDPDEGEGERGIRALEAELTAVRASKGHARPRVVGDLPQVVEHEVDDRLHLALAALLLDEALQVVVAVTLGGHRPELAEDADLRLRAKAIDLDRGELLASADERHEHAAVLGQRFVDVCLRGLDRTIRRAGHHLVRADAVREEVQHVAREERLHDRQEERGTDRRSPPPRPSPARCRPRAGRASRGIHRSPRRAAPCGTR